MATFKVQLGSETGAVLNKVKALIEANGGQFKGNQTTGEFVSRTLLGEVGGKYTVQGQCVTIDIVKKPFVVPQSRIERVIQDYFAS